MLRVIECILLLIVRFRIALLSQIVLSLMRIIVDPGNGELVLRVVGVDQPQ